MVHFTINPETTKTYILLFLKSLFCRAYQTMDASLRLIRKIIPASSIISSLLFGTCSTSLAVSIKPEAFETLDKRFQQFSQDFYNQVNVQAILPLKKYTTAEELRIKVDAHIKSGKTTHAIALIHHNQEMLRNNIDAIEIIPLTALLLKHNDWHEAKKILDIAKNEAGKSATSNISFEFAKYFMKKRKWQTAFEYLNNISNELSPENADYAQLMIGTILQHQKKHREAIEYYTKINPSSKYYSVAILNTAIAYIRQDWWTDAHTLINETIDKHKEQVTDIMSDRDRKSVV